MLWELKADQTGWLRVIGGKTGESWEKKAWSWSLEFRFDSQYIAKPLECLSGSMISFLIYIQDFSEK